MSEGKGKMMTKLLQCTAAALMGAALMLEAPLAQAGGSGRYDAPKRSGPSVWDRMTGGMNTGGFANIASNFYIAGRGALLFYDDATITGTAPVISGYEPDAAAIAAGTETDFTSVFGSAALSRGVSRSVPGVWSAEPSGGLAGGGGAALGYALPFDIPFGDVRLEFDYGYQQYRLENVKTCVVPRDFLPESSILEGAALAEQAQNIANMREGVSSGAAITIADNREAARMALGEVLGPAQGGKPTVGTIGTPCPTDNHDAPVHTFLFNALYDIDLVKAMDAFGFAGMNALAGLGMHFGVGVGYMLVEVENRTEVVIADADEPSYNPTVGELNDLETTADADANDNDTVVNLEDAELLESGFYLPVYVGLSYSLQTMLNVPVTLEATYRYNAVVPDNLGEHGMIFGARYHF